MLIIETRSSQKYSVDEIFDLLCELRKMRKSIGSGVWRSEVHALNGGFADEMPFDLCQTQDELATLIRKAQGSDALLLRFRCVDRAETVGCIALQINLEAK